MSKDESLVEAQNLTFLNPFFLWYSHINDGRNFFVWLIFMVLIFVALGLLETFLGVSELGYLFEQQFVIS